jgi:hypothetical protein
MFSTDILALTDYSYPERRLYRNPPGKDGYFLEKGRHHPEKGRHFSEKGRHSSKKGLPFPVKGRPYPTKRGRPQ